MTSKAAERLTSNVMVPAAQYEAMRAERDSWQATAEILELPVADLLAAERARCDGRIKNVPRTERLYLLILSIGAFTAGLLIGIGFR